MEGPRHDRCGGPRVSDDLATQVPAEPEAEPPPSPKREGASIGKWQRMGRDHVREHAMNTGISHNQAFAQKHRHKSLVTVAVTYLAVSQCWLFEATLWHVPSPLLSS